MNIIAKEWKLIASENFTSKSVMQCVGSVLTNKYSEGKSEIDITGLDISMRLKNYVKKSIKMFRLAPSKWDVNVQPFELEVLLIWQFILVY